MLARPYLPSGLELSKFERYVAAVQNPKQVLENFSEGRMSREEGEAIKNVYPNLWSSMQEKAINYVGANPSLPYGKKLQLGILLGVQTDPSLAPQNIIGLQSNFASQQPQPAQTGTEGAVKPSQKGLQNLNFSGRIKGEEQED